MRAVLAAAFLAVCLVLGAPALAEDGVLHWKIGTLAPAGMGWAKHAEEIMIAETTRATEGCLKLEVFWGGVMGDDEDYLSKMRIGQLQGAGLSGQGCSLACPEFSVVQLPFMFRDYTEVDHIRSAMFDEFDARFSRYGLKLMYWMDQDFDQIYSSRTPLFRLENFRDMRFVLWCGPVEESLFCALDADSVPLNVPESAAAQRQGLVNACIAPAAWMVGAQLQNVVKFVHPMKIRYSPVAVVVTRKAWKSLPDKYKASYAAERDAITQGFTARVREDNQKSLDALIAYGVARVDMAPGELARLKEAVQCVNTQLSGIAFPADLLETVQERLTEFRAAKGTK